ncbi:MAG: hypothetical protein IPP12_22105 [Nitrospira sp.]|nr:hypothetical protein [Nitrospira sp.]
MYTAYLDETGQQSNGWVFVAGFMGNEAQWEDFIPKWKFALGPQRRRLHMNALRWNRPSTRELLLRLSQIPAESGLTGIVGGVRYSDYGDLVSGTVVEKLSEGYLWSLFPLVETVLKAIPENKQLRLVFDDQPIYRNRALDVLSMIADESPNHSEWMTSAGVPKLAKWEFVTKESTILLDPSDYYASAWAHYYRDQSSQKAQWCLPLLNATTWVGKILNREEIRGQVIRCKAAMDRQGISLHQSY